MFGDLIKELENLKSISVPVEADQDGYIDKQCPSESCEFIFKVNEDDWSENFQDEAVYCPLCRHEAPSDKWFTTEQIEHAKSEAFEVVQGKVNKALNSGARKFNQSQPRKSFIKMSMKVTGPRHRTYAIPAKAAQEMALKIECEACESKFSVIGSAYFCPCCGHNSVVQMFSDSLRKIRAKKEASEVLRASLESQLSKDEAELTCRSLIETCVIDAVVAFQKYCEGMYEPFGKTKMNVFQRLDDGSKLWKDLLGEGYSDWLSDDEMNELKVLFNKRHLLSHNEGIVDQKYLDKSGDTNYINGQRVVISNNDINTAVDLIDKLATNIKLKVNTL